MTASEDREATLAFHGGTAGALAPFGLFLAGVVSYFMLHRQAREVVEARVELMMNAARAVRGYTVQEVRPNLKKLAVDDPVLIVRDAAAEAIQRIVG